MIVATVLLGATLALPPANASPAAKPLCAALARHVDAAGRPGNGPLFLQSYEPGPDEAALPPPLAHSAFSYDNALAIMALAACGDLRRSRRIADAFVSAAAHDRTFADGRIRNAYRAGPLDGGAAKLPGWWDAKQNLWAEDPYQDGTQTGNVAWAALSLLFVDHAGGTTTYRPTAIKLASWINNHTKDGREPGGFNGGTDGYDNAQTTLMWRSTEHNVDVNALGAWLRRVGQGQPGQGQLGEGQLGDGQLGEALVGPSRRFLDAMFDSKRGMFRLGTLPDGKTQPPNRVALDALTWPIIGVAEAPADWQRSLDYARDHLATKGGYDFNGSRGELWTEGTAQQAFIAGATGHPGDRSALLATVMKLEAPSGYLYATSAGRIATGIAIGPASEGEDLFYYHRPHLGATAWAVLAATGANPFTGQIAP